MNVQERFKNIIKKSFDSLLEEYEFKKRGSYYLKESEELLYKIKIEKAWYNTKNSLTFDLVWEIYPTPSMLKKIPFPFLVDLIGGDLVKLESGKNALFSLEETDQNSNETDDKMIVCLQKLLEKVLRVILELKNIKNIINVLENTLPKDRFWRTPSPFSEDQTKDWIACMYYMIGEKKKGIKILDNMIKESNNPTFRKNLEETRDQMISGL